MCRVRNFFLSFSKSRGSIPDTSYFCQRNTDLLIEDFLSTCDPCPCVAVSLCVEKSSVLHAPYDILPHCASTVLVLATVGIIRELILETRKVGRLQIKGMMLDNPSQQVSLEYMLENFMKHQIMLSKSFVILDLTYFYAYQENIHWAKRLLADTRLRMKMIALVGHFSTLGGAYASSKNWRKSLKYALALKQVALVLKDCAILFQCELYIGYANLWKGNSRQAHLKFETLMSKCQSDSQKRQCKLALQSV